MVQGLLSEKRYLGFQWEALLYHLQDTLLQHGVLSGWYLPPVPAVDPQWFSLDPDPSL